IVAGELEPEDCTEPAVERARLSSVIGVTGFVEDEFVETGAGTELTVFRSLEWRSALRLRERVGIEGSWRIDGRVVNSDPGGVEYLAIGVEVEHVVRFNVRVGLARMEHDRCGCIGSQRKHLQGLELATDQQIARVGRDEAINKTVRLLGEIINGAVGASNILDDDQCSMVVRLNSFIAALSNYSRQIFHS